MRAAWLLGFWLVSTLASADDAVSSPYLERPNPLHALLPSAPALRARAQARLESQMARALSSLADVRRADVVLSLPPADQLALDRPLPAARANVLLELTGSGPRDDQALRVVQSALPELAAERVRILRRHATASPPTEAHTATERVGPFVVARASSRALRASLAACLALNALLAALLIARLRAR